MIFEVYSSESDEKKCSEIYINRQYCDRAVRVIIFSAKDDSQHSYRNTYLVNLKSFSYRGGFQILQSVIIL